MQIFNPLIGQKLNLIKSYRTKRSTNDYTKTSKYTSRKFKTLSHLRRKNLASKIKKTAQRKQKYLRASLPGEAFRLNLKSNAEMPMSEASSEDELTQNSSSDQSQTNLFEAGGKTNAIDQHPQPKGAKKVLSNNYGPTKVVPFSQNFTIKRKIHDNSSDDEGSPCSLQTSSSTLIKGKISLPRKRLYVTDSDHKDEAKSSDDAQMVVNVNNTSHLVVDLCSPSGYFQSSRKEIFSFYLPSVIICNNFTIESNQSSANFDPLKLTVIPNRSSFDTANAALRTEIRQQGTDELLVHFHGAGRIGKSGLNVLQNCYKLIEIKWNYQYELQWLQDPFGISFSESSQLVEFSLSTGNQLDGPLKCIRDDFFCIWRTLFS